MRAKAGASIASAGVLFGLVAAALAAVAASEDARKEFRCALDALRAVSLYGWLGVFLAVALPYFVVWQERFISKASVRCKAKEENEKEDEDEDEEQAKLREEEAKLRQKRTWILWIFAILPALAFFLTPLAYQPPPGSRLSGLFLSSALEVSGLISLLLSILFLFFSLELYDSASGWRGGPKLHFHLAGVASHSFLFGATLALVGLSLLFTFLNESVGRIVVSVSLLATVSVTEIERYLFLYHRNRRRGVQKSKTGG